MHFQCIPILKMAMAILFNLYQELPDMIISAESIDTLACGRLTGNLGFKSSPSNPAYPECSE